MEKAKVEKKEESASEAEAAGDKSNAEKAQKAVADSESPE